MSPFPIIWFPCLSGRLLYSALLFLLQLIAFTAGNNVQGDAIGAIDSSITEGEGHTLWQLWEANNEAAISYEASFQAFDKSITGRADASITALENNTPMNSNILPNSTVNYEFPLTAILQSRSNIFMNDEMMKEHDTNIDESDEHGEELRKRQSATAPNVYITMNTCLQPVFANSTLQANPPQLTLWVSTSDQNQYPGPLSPSATSVPLVQGYANITVPSVSSNVYIGISADYVNITSSVWNYEVAVSTDQNYHSYINGLPALHMSDSDPSAALLVTKNLSVIFGNDSNTTNIAPQLSLFVQQGDDTATQGLQQSFCGLQKNSKVQGIPPNIPPGGIETSITAYGEQIFYVPNLNASSNYTAMLALAPNATSGGTVYNSMTFFTKQLANCQIIYDLSFCSTVAYAVPANPDNFPNMSSLAAAYDNSTQAAYQLFTYSLQQIPCNTTATAQYSLVKNCDDCAAAYKTWLCAVSIPRCADWTDNPGFPAWSGAQATDTFGSAIDYLMPRNANQTPIAATSNLTQPVTNDTLLNWVAFNSSRNSALITDIIAPGPYMEVLPCEDLCYGLLQTCPAAFGFGCPYSGRGLEWSYGKKVYTLEGAVTCNEPGAVWGVSTASRFGGWSRTVLGVWTGMVALLLMR